MMIKTKTSGAKKQTDTFQKFNSPLNRHCFHRLKPNILILFYQIIIGLNISNVYLSSVIHNVTFEREKSFR